MVAPNMLESPQPLAKGKVRAATWPSPAGGVTAEATAHYIAQLTAALAPLSKRSGLRLLTYLLDMARLEAEFHCHCAAIKSPARRAALETGLPSAPPRARLEAHRM
ncbi:hypothetical protein [Methylocapsa acidiphila]|uniref:hypothetical protein n=1 Tax=Methylocapsa acidiphila TaxID=133552 RepID=UPI000568101D|nr:hypothetical protein [Methylocapsa acidiphila]